MAEVNYYFSDVSFNEEDERFFSKYAKNRLISYHYQSSIRKYFEIYRKFNGEILNIKDYNILIDSGAYSIWNSGKPPIDVHDYKKFCLELLISISDLPFNRVEFINLDVIPGERNKPVTRKDILYAQEKSLENYLILKNFVPNLLPVFHQGDDFKYLNIIEENTLRYCVSPANDKHVSKRLIWIQDVFAKANKNFKPHGLGFSNATIAKKNPWFSFDASTHNLRGGYGVIMYPLDDKLIDIVVSDQRSPEETGTHFENFSKEEKEKILQELLSIDKRFTYDQIKGGYHATKTRTMINVYFINKFYSNFVNPSNIIQQNLF